MAAVARLRSQLSCASPDLRALAARDLEELTWATRQRIIAALCQESALLQDEHSDLMALTEQRSEQMARWRRQGDAGKEERRAFEETFRLRLLQTFVRGLEKLKWPPAVEAFGNPLPALQADKEFFLEAAAFVAQVLHPQLAHSPIPSPRPSARAPPSSITPPKTGRALESCAGQIEIRGADLPLSSAAPVDDERAHFADTAPRALLQDLGECVPWRQRETESRLLSLLQNQNELLRGRVARLSEAMHRREESEVMIGNILRELKGALREVAGAADGAPTSSSSSSSLSVGAAAPSRALQGTSKKLLSTLQALDQQWAEARKAARAAAIEAQQDGPRVGKELGRLQRIAQQRPALAHNHSFVQRDEQSADGLAEATAAIAQEAHALQRDLVRLGEAALRVSEALGEGSDEASELRRASGNLALRVARFGPLASAAPPGSALDRLGGLAAALPRSAALTVQEVAEAVALEQQALQRDHLRLQRQSRRYAQLLRRAQEQCAYIHKSLPATVRIEAQALREGLRAAKEVVVAVRRAEGSRVQALGSSGAPSSARSVASAGTVGSAAGRRRSEEGGIAPLELLAQGRGGTEVAQFVLTLRSHISELDALDDTAERYLGAVESAVQRMVAPLGAGAEELAAATTQAEHWATRRPVQPMDRDAGGVGATVSTRRSPVKQQRSPGSGGKAARSSSAPSRALKERPPFDLSS